MYIHICMYMHISYRYGRERERERESANFASILDSHPESPARYQKGSERFARAEAARMLHAEPSQGSLVVPSGG